MWHLYGDFHDVATGTVGPHRVPRPKGWDLIAFVAGKVVSIGLLLGVPMLVHPWWVVLIFYALVAVALGVTLTVVFQLAHCVGEADFPQPIDGGRRMADAWAVHQLHTTVDFARNSRVLTWLLGGLNFQVVHHLFPRACHVHYPGLARIVENTCREFGVRYSAHRSFVAGIAAHYRWLRHLGRPISRSIDAEPEAGRVRRVPRVAPAARDRRLPPTRAVLMSPCASTERPALNPWEYLTDALTQLAAEPANAGSTRTQRMMCRGVRDSSRVALEDTRCHSQLRRRLQTCRIPVRASNTATTSSLS
ncbi:Fatty acid desaturase [Gemmata sp. SH-PL17]|nr:Fatty acid desaturase [Gemmata sp. SH-PL17]